MDTLKGCVLVDGGGIQLLDSQNHKHKDIELYIEKRLANNSMVSNEQRRLIAEQSGGLFLYAATVCRLLADRRRASVLRTLLATGSSRSLVEKMNQLYFSILKQVSVDDTLDKYIMDVLSAIIVAFKPLSVDLLCEYLPEDIPVAQTVKLLGAVIKCDDHEHPIKILHPTFREFLLSSDAGTYFIDPGLPHTEMACSSMDILERSLRYNALRIDGADQLTPFNNAVSDLNERLSKYMTPATQYASIFWASHAIAAESTAPRRLWSRVVKFLRTMFLNWVELMSWKGEMATCVNSLFRLHVKAKRVHSEDARILTQDELLSIKHAYQFVVNHQKILSDSALQAYSVPLFFTPAQSPLFSHYRQQYRSQQPDINTPVVIDWDRRLSLGSHSDYLQEYLFSPDVTRLLTVGGLKGGGDELFLWDTETGAILRKLPCGNRFRSCSFSPDGQHLAILAKDQVHIHSSDTGETIVAPFQVTFENSKLPGSFPCLFSSEKSRITVVTDTFAHIFDFKMGIEVQAIDIRDGRCISGAIFSPNQTRLATLAHNGSQTHVTAWDLENLRVISSEAVDKRLIGGKFSPDGARLATWGLNYCQLWSLSVNQISITAESVTGPLHEALFSSSGNYFALRSDFNEIEVWDCETGDCLFAVEIPGGGEVFFSFSEDEQKLGVLTLDKGRTTLEGMTPDHITDEVPSRRGFPKDGAEWFSRWGNNGLEICKLMYRKNKNVGTSIYTGIYSAITALGPLLVIVGILREHEVGIQVWSLAGNTASKSFKPGINFNLAACDVIFSPNGQRIAMTFDGEESEVGWMYIWNTRTWDEEIVCGQGFIESCIFLPNSELLSALFLQLGNDEKRQYTLGVWNLQTLEVIWQYNFELSALDNSCGLIFSPDGTSILVCSRDATMYISNFGQDTQILRKEVEGQMQCCLNTAFSPSGALVAVIREDEDFQKQIQLWQIDTSLTLLDTIRVDTSDHPPELIFSSDEKYLAYGRSHC
ncbi:hypothetical protein FRC17_002865 [Serendipita sp. 399]|nr:hypothetical protein FRC17_002865 [Serendipita sp. 399]